MKKICMLIGDASMRTASYSVELKQEGNIPDQVALFDTLFSLIKSLRSFAWIKNVLHLAYVGYIQQCASMNRLVICGSFAYVCVTITNLFLVYPNVLASLRREYLVGT